MMQLSRKYTLPTRIADLYRMTDWRCLAAISLIVFNSTIINAEENKSTPLSIDEFIRLATKNDVVFESILLDQLPLKYRRDALLPDQDILFSIKQNYQVYLDSGHDRGQSGISLSKLFAASGSRVSIDYSKPTTINSDRANLQFMISQPIARNAFGKSFQLLDQIIGIENDIIQYQIIEAYEDYLGAVIAAYYNWYSSYENLQLGQASLNSSKKLLQNILDRQRQNIALPIDVNKMKLSLINKQENLLLLEEEYTRNSNIIFKSIRSQGSYNYFPINPKSRVDNVDYDREFSDFVQKSRTYQILELLEKQSSLEVKKSADELLPSTNLLLGYDLEGDQWGDRERQDRVFAGIEFSFPLGRSVAKANYEIQRIQYHKTKLSKSNKYQELQVNLKNLYLQIQREKKLIDISLQKIKLADAILKDESENYSFGKVSLNDYINAVNTADENHFSHTAHSVQLNKLLVEWQRLTDKLVDRSFLAPAN